MNTKTILFTLLLVIGFVFPNCDISDDIDCSCPPIDGGFFDIQGFKLSHGEKINSDAGSPIIGQDSINFADYHGILLEYEVDYHSNNTQNWDWDFSLMPTALSCSCIENGWEGSATEKLENLTIITQNDFNNEFLAGDTLNNLIQISNPWFSNDMLDINEYLTQDTMNVLSQNLWIHLKQAPQAIDSFQVKVIVQLSENETYEMESLPIKITQ